MKLKRMEVEYVLLQNTLIVYLPQPGLGLAKYAFFFNAMLQFSHFDPLFPNVLPNMLQIFHIMLAKLVENTKTSMRQKKEFMTYTTA